MDQFLSILSKAGPLFMFTVMQCAELPHSSKYEGYFGTSFRSLFIKGVLSQILDVDISYSLLVCALTLIGMFKLYTKFVLHAKVKPLWT
jgi:hypothetical protein